MPRTWRDTFLDPSFLITLWITGQFFVLICLFGMKYIQLSTDASVSILNTYTVAFTAAWGYWIGSSAGSKAKDDKIASMSPPPPPNGQK